MEYDGMVKEYEGVAEGAELEAIVKADIDATIAEVEKKIAKEKEKITAGASREDEKAKQAKKDAVKNLAEYQQKLAHWQQVAAEQERAIQARAEAAAEAGGETPDSEPKPVGKGMFGNIYDQFKGKVKEALDFLLSKKEGDLAGVFHRKEIGDIDLVWGDRAKDMGLDHIIAKHVGEGKSFASAEDAINAINDIIANGELSYDTTDKAVFKIGSKLVTIRKNIRQDGKKIADKNWVLTAYDEMAADGGVSAIAATNQAQAARGAAKSRGKGTQKAGNMQTGNASEERVEAERKAYAAEAQKGAIKDVANAADDALVGRMEYILQLYGLSDARQSPDDMFKYQSMYDAVDAEGVEIAKELEKRGYKVTVDGVEKPNQSAGTEGAADGGGGAGGAGAKDKQPSEESTQTDKPVGDTGVIVTNEPLKDNQGNPVDNDGNLILEEVAVKDITEEDFTAPKRNVKLPNLPKKVDDAIGADGKPVIIKKNVFAKNKENHNDLTAEESRNILSECLYNPDLYGQNKKTTRPYNWILIYKKGEQSAVVVEVNPTKDNIEIVNWHYLSDKTLKQKENQAIKEGGLILKLPESNPVGDTAKDGMASGSKGTEKVANTQKDNAEKDAAEQSGEDKALKDFEDENPDKVFSVRDKLLEMGKGIKNKVASIWNFIGKDKTRPVLMGVYNDKGVQVATDTHVLIAVKGKYPKEHEGKIVDKKGNVIPGVYPNYKAVKPKDCVDAGVSVDDLLNAAKAVGKIIPGKKGVNVSSVIKIGDTYYDTALLVKHLPTIKAQGLTEVKITKDRNPNMRSLYRNLMFEGKNGWALIMPCMAHDFMPKYDIRSGKLYIPDGSELRDAERATARELLGGERPAGRRNSIGGGNVPAQEQFDALKELCDRRGIEVVYTGDFKLPNGRTSDGYVDGDGVIHLNAEKWQNDPEGARNAFARVVGHEITHTTEGLTKFFKLTTSEYNKFMFSLRHSRGFMDWALQKVQGDMDTRFEELYGKWESAKSVRRRREAENELRERVIDMYVEEYGRALKRGFSRDEAEREMFADYMGEALFTQKDFLKRLLDGQSVETQKEVISVWRKIGNFLRSLVGQTRYESMAEEYQRLADEFTAAAEMNDARLRYTDKALEMYPSRRKGGDKRHMFLGEKGAANADKAEGTTVRMDNLKVAEEMEKEYKELQGSDEHKRMIEASKRVRELSAIPVEAHSMNRDEQKALYASFGNATNKETGIVAKFFSSGFKKNHREDGLFEKALPNLKDAFESAILAYSETDNLAGKERKDGSIHKQHRSITSYDNYVNKLRIDGKDYYVRFTVQRQPNADGVHSSFITNVELYENPAAVASGKSSNGQSRLDYNGIVDAKLRNFFNMASETEKDFAKKMKLATGWERGVDGKWRYEQADFNVDPSGGRVMYEIAEKFPYNDELDELEKKAEDKDYELTAEESARYEELLNMFNSFLTPRLWDAEKYLSYYMADDSLLKAYPELKDTRVVSVNSPETWTAGYSPESNSIYLNKNRVNNLHSTLLHEVQHAIQGIEGFAKGGSEKAFAKMMDDLKERADAWTWYNDLVALGKEMPEATPWEVERELEKRRGGFATRLNRGDVVSDHSQYLGFYAFENGFGEKDLRDAYNKWNALAEQGLSGIDGYKRIAGEVEARNVQTRMGYTEEQRRQRLASETEDVPRDQQLVRYKLGDAPETFEERQRRAVENRGTVMPGLNDTEVRVVDVPKHPYTGTISEATAQARKAAIDKYTEVVKDENGKERRISIPQTYDNYGTSFEYGISANAISEYLNPKQQAKSANKGVHLALAEHIDEVIGNSIEVEEHPDYLKNTDGIRDMSAVHPDNLMHRFYGAVNIDGKPYRVMTLMRERMDAGNGLHAYEVTKVELLDKEPSSTSGEGSVPSVEVSYPLAKLLQDVEKSYDSGKNILDESRKADEQLGKNRYSIRRFGGNSGYVGYSMSRRAAQAREDGKYPKTDFKREYGVTDKALESLVKAGVISDKEWHHTSMYGNKTTFYAWNNDIYAEIYKSNKAEVDKAARGNDMATIEKLFDDNGAEYARVEAEIDRAEEEARAAAEARAAEYKRENEEYERKRQLEEQEFEAKWDAIKGNYEGLKFDKRNFYDEDKYNAFISKKWVNYPVRVGETVYFAVPDKYGFGGKKTPDKLWIKAQIANAANDGRQADGTSALDAGSRNSVDVRTMDDEAAAAAGEHNRYSVVRDEEYAAAVERGDMEAAQKLVDERAKAAGYHIRAYHGTTKYIQVPTPDERYYGYNPYEKIPRFDGSTEIKTFVPNSHFGTKFAAIRRADRVANGRDVEFNLEPVVYPVYIKADKLKEVDDSYDVMKLDTHSESYQNRYWNEECEKAKAEGYDGLVYYNTYEGGTSVVIFEPSAIKSAEAVTRDDNGNLIPLSQRFNAANADVRYSLPEKEAGSKIDEYLEKQSKGELPAGFVYNFGLPSEKLIAVGFPEDSEIELSASHLNSKSKKKIHPFNVADIKGLLHSLRNPIAVFPYGDKSKAVNAIIDIRHNGDNFLLGVHFINDGNKRVKATIRGVFPKYNTEWLKWIENGEAIGIDKSKVIPIIEEMRDILSDKEKTEKYMSHRLTQGDLTDINLDSVANIVENFGKTKSEEIVLDDIENGEVRYASDLENRFKPANDGRRNSIGPVGETPLEMAQRRLAEYRAAKGVGGGAREKSLGERLREAERKASARVGAATSNAEEMAAAHQAVGDYVREALAAGSVDKTQKRELNALLRNAAKAKDAQTLQGCLQDVRDVVTAITIRKQLSEAERLLATPTTTRDTQNRTRVASVDANARRTLDLVNGALKQAKETQLDADIKSLRSLIWNMQKDLRAETDPAKQDAIRQEIEDMKAEQEQLKAAREQLQSEQMTEADWRGKREQFQKKVDDGGTLTEDEEADFNGYNILALFAEAKQIEKDGVSVESVDTAGNSTTEIVSVEKVQQRIAELTAQLHKTRTWSDRAAIKQEIAICRDELSALREKQSDLYRAANEQLHATIGMGRLNLKEQKQKERELQQEIVSEADAKIVNHTQFLRTSKGEVYGFVKDGKMYLDPERINPNTPIHEYTHLYDNVLMKENPALWAKWKDLVRGTQLWKDVLGDEAYADIAGNEDLVAGEVKARLTGQKGEERLQALVDDAKKNGSAMEYAETKTFVSRVKDMLRSMWESTKQWLANSNVFRDKFTKQQIASMSVDDFLNKTLDDFARGVNPLEYGGKAEAPAVAGGHNRYSIVRDEELKRYSISSDEETRKKERERSCTGAMIADIEKASSKLSATDESAQDLMDNAYITKVLINSDNRKTIYDNFDNVSKIVDAEDVSAVDFLQELQQSFQLRTDGTGYARIDVEGVPHTLRIADHSINAKNNTKNSEKKNFDSVVIRVAKRSHFTPADDVELTEYINYPKLLTREKQQAIIKGLQDWLTTGVYNVKADRVNTLPKKVIAEMVDLAARDAEYERAVERGDMEAAQKMVDEAAQKSLSKSVVRNEDGSLMTMYHGGIRGTGFTVFDKGKIGSSGAGSYEGLGFNFTSSEIRASSYGNGSVMSVYLDAKKSASDKGRKMTFDKFYDIFRKVEDANETKITEEYGYYPANSSNMFKTARYIYEYAKSNAELNAQMAIPFVGDANTFHKAWKEAGFDSVMWHDKYSGKVSTVVVFDPEQIKSAEAVTRDDNGNVVPLSERFNVANADVRYSIKVGRKRKPYYVDIKDKREYAVVRSSLFNRYAGESAFGTIAYSGNKLYICDYFGDGEFKARAILDIDTDKETVNKITNGEEIGTYRDPDAFIRRAANIKVGAGGSGRSDVDDENRTATSGNDRLDSSESQGRGDAYATGSSRDGSGDYTTVKTQYDGSRRPRILFVERGEETDSNGDRYSIGPIGETPLEMAKRRLAEYRAAKGVGGGAVSSRNSRNSRSSRIARSSRKSRRARRARRARGVYGASLGAEGGGGARRCGSTGGG